MPQPPENSTSPPDRGPGLLFDPPVNSDAVEAPSPSAEPQTPEHRMPRWLERAELFLRVLLQMYIGLIACYAPWWHLFWDMNPLFLHYPTLGAFAAHGEVRGLVTGLGLLNLWIAFQEALRRWDK